MIISLVGNSLSLTVILWSKKLRSQPPSMYLIGLSILGICIGGVVMIHPILWFWEAGSPMDVLRDSNDWACKLHTYFTYLLVQYYAALQATIAVDRCLIVIIPLRYRLLVSKAKTLIIMLVEFCVLACWNGVYIRILHINPQGFCTSQPKYRGLLMNVVITMDLIFAALLPGAVMLVCYIIIIITYSRRRFTSRNRQQRSKLRSVFVVLNAVFLATSVPIAIYGYFPPKNGAIVDQIEWVFHILNLNAFIGIAFSFLLYCITGSVFRNQLIKLFTCLERTPIASQNKSIGLKASGTQITGLASVSHIA